MHLDTDKLLDLIDNKKRRNITITSIIGSMILGFYIIVNISLGDYLVAIYELICVAIFICCLYLLLKKGNYDLPANLTAGVISTLAIHNFNSGGFDSTGLFWVFVLTSIIFYLKGKDAWIWVLFIHIVIGTLFILHIFGIRVLIYDTFTISTFYVALVTISIFSHLYNANLDLSIQNLKSRTYELEDAKLELSLESTKVEAFKRAIEDKELDLKSYHQSLLKREENIKRQQKEIKLALKKTERKSK